MEDQYFVAIKGQSKGPYTIEDIKGLNLIGENLIWRQGLLAWTRADEIEELKDIIRILPSILPKVSPPPLPILSDEIKKANSSESQIKEESDLKRRMIKIYWVKRLNKMLKCLKYTVPLFLTIYCLLAYFDGGFSVLILSNKYSQFTNDYVSSTPYHNPKLYDGLTTPNQIDSAYYTEAGMHYNSLSPDQKRQVFVEQQIDSLMVKYKYREVYSVLGIVEHVDYVEIFKKKPISDYVLKPGIYFTAYHNFLNARMNIAFGITNILIALSIFILSNLLILFIPARSGANA
jgi:hypothetical protein